MEWKNEWFKCPKMDFTIRGSIVLEILSDKTHIIHRFMTAHDRSLIDGAIQELQNQT